MARPAAFPGAKTRVASITARLFARGVAMVRTVLLARAMRRRLGFGLGAALPIAGVMLACGAARLPAPPYTGHPTEALQEVDYPPPPARAEYVPTPPPAGAMWLDGEWTWQGKRWAWKQGRWVIPPAGARYSPWTTTRDRLGTLYFAEGRWRDAKGAELPDPKPVSLGRTRAGPVIDPEGEPTPVANVPASSQGAKDRDGGNDGGPPETPSGATPSGTEPKGAPVIPDGGPTSDGGTTADGGSSPRMGTP